MPTDYLRLWLLLAARPATTGAATVPPGTGVPLGDTTVPLGVLLPCNALYYKGPHLDALRAGAGVAGRWARDAGGDPRWRERWAALARCLQVLNPHPHDHDHRWLPPACVQLCVLRVLPSSPTSKLLDAPPALWSMARMFVFCISMCVLTLCLTSRLRSDNAITCTTHAHTRTSTVSHKLQPQDVLAVAGGSPAPLPSGAVAGGGSAADPAAAAAAAEPASLVLEGGGSGDGALVVRATGMDTVRYHIRAAVCVL